MPTRIPRPHDLPKAPTAPSKPLYAPVPTRVPESAPEGAKSRTKTLDLGLFSGRKPVFVGIDQSLTAFGLAAYSTDGTAFIWVHATENRGVRRLFDIGWFVRSTLQQITLRCGTDNLRHVVMEGYAFSRQMGHALGECGATTKLALVQALGYCNPLAYPTIPTSQQVKKFATSKGNANKDQMLLAVYKKWGVEVSDANAADAYTMARMGAGIEVPEHLDYDYERQVIGVLERNTEWPTLDTTKPSTSSAKARKASSG